MYIDLMQILPTIGFIGILAIVFAESGLFFGFFLPGDSLLFTAGFLVSQNKLGVDIWTLAVGCFIAAVLGDSVGYAFGKRVGRRLFNREDSWFFHKSSILKAEEFYKKHGKKTIVLARFVPAVRTFAPIVAGIGSMDYKTFLIYNVLGGLLWGVGLTVLGYYMGNLIPKSIIEPLFIFIVLTIILVSLLPAILHIMGDEEARNGIKKQLNRGLELARKSWKNK